MQLVHQFDQKYTTRIQRLPAAWRPVMLALSIIGEPWLVFLIGLASFIIAAGQPNQAVEKAFIYSAVAYGLNISLKLLLHRNRPHGRIVKTLGIQSYSFPSGHAFGTVLLYGLLADLGLKHLHHPANFIAGFILAGMIILTGISRVYLGSHYPSDVIAGWLLGAISLAIIVSAAL